MPFDARSFLKNKKEAAIGFDPSKFMSSTDEMEALEEPVDTEEGFTPSRFVDQMRKQEEEVTHLQKLDGILKEPQFVPQFTISPYMEKGERFSKKPKDNQEKDFQAQAEDSVKAFENISFLKSRIPGMPLDPEERDAALKAGALSQKMPLYAKTAMLTADALHGAVAGAVSSIPFAGHHIPTGEPGELGELFAIPGEIGGTIGQLATIGPLALIPMLADTAVYTPGNAGDKAVAVGMNLAIIALFHTGGVSGNMALKKWGTTTAKRALIHSAKAAGVGLGTFGLEKAAGVDNTEALITALSWAALPELLGGRIVSRHKGKVTEEFIKDVENSVEKLTVREEFKKHLPEDLKRLMEEGEGTPSEQSLRREPKKSEIVDNIRLQTQKEVEARVGKSEKPVEETVKEVPPPEVAEQKAVSDLVDPLKGEIPTTAGEAKQQLATQTGKEVKGFPGIWKRFKDYLRNNITFKTPEVVFKSEKPVSTDTLDVFKNVLKESLSNAETITGERATALKEISVKVDKLTRRGDLTPTEQSEQIALAMSGKHPRLKLQKFVEKFSKSQVEELTGHLLGHESIKNRQVTKGGLSIALHNLLLKGEVPFASQIAMFEKIFGPNISSGLISKYGKTNHSMRKIVNALNATKSAVTCVDLSYAMRQGHSLVLSDVKGGAAAMGASLRALGSEEYARGVEEKIAGSEYFDLGQKAKLSITDLFSQSAKLKEHEEAFQSNWFRKLEAARTDDPKVKVILGAAKAATLHIRASERAHVTFLNKFRSDYFENGMRDLVSEGIDPHKPENFKTVKAFADYINAATGRGNVEKLGEFAETLNSLWFSPRFVVSRFSYWKKLGGMLKSPSKAMRKRGLRALRGKAIFWGGLAALAKMGAEAFGWDTDVNITDPLRSDFMKFKVGEKTYDITGGYGTAARFVFQALPGIVRDRETGKIRRTDLIERFASFSRYKSSPWFATYLQLQRGKQFFGEPLTVGSVLMGLTTPLTIQQAVELWNEDGAAGLAFMPPEILGMGLQIEKDRGPKFQW